MSASTSADVTLITGTNAGAQVPYVSEWVQGSTTATYTLIGQVLDSGETNFVGECPESQPKPGLILRP
jgi:hypothetical protein